jgi:hypothetical protein
MGLNATVDASWLLPLEPMPPLSSRYSAHLGALQPTPLVQMSLVSDTERRLRT